MMPGCYFFLSVLIYLVITLFWFSYYRARSLTTKIVLIISDDLFFLYTCRCLFNYLFLTFLMSDYFLLALRVDDERLAPIVTVFNKFKSKSLVYAVMRKFIFISCIFKKGITNILAA